MKTREIIELDPCGCKTQIVTDTWMGEEIKYEETIVCSEHW